MFRNGDFARKRTNLSRNFCMAIWYVTSPQIIAQAFCLRFKEYGKTDAIKDFGNHRN
jgi:hypothetical protein